MYKAADKIYNDLSLLADLSYRDFQAKLMPTVDKENILGVRIPALRKYAKRLSKDSVALSDFLSDLPHKTYEENTLHAILIQSIKDVDECLLQIERFVPYVDNWSTCDTIVPTCLKSEPKKVKSKCEEWLHSSHSYTVRLGMVILMKFFLDDNFDHSVLEVVAAVRSDEYYVQMAQAWFFSFALIKQYDAALPYVTEHRLSSWVHNKTIQKSIESFQISNEKKAYLRTLRI